MSRASSRNGGCQWIVIASLVLSITGVCQADEPTSLVSFSTLHVFHRSTDEAQGAHPGSLTFGKDGDLYGVTRDGGVADAGTIFRISPDGEFKTIHQFRGPDGLNPYGCLVPGGDGTLYGSTNEFGPRRTVFSLTLGDEFTTIYVFPEPNDDHFSVQVRGLDGRLYAIDNSEAGFALFEGMGTAAVQKDVSIVTESGSTSGARDIGPRANTASICPGPVITAEGRVYGGAHGLAARISTKFPDPNLLYAGGIKGALAIDKDGDIYGISSWSGGNESGIVKISATGVVTLAYSFKAAGLDGSPSFGLVRSPSGYFYGIAQGVGSTIYRFKPGHDIERVHVEKRDNASFQFMSLVADPSKETLYGTYATYYDAKDGAIFRLEMKP